MLEGVVPFPPEFAQRYRRRGYWADQSLAQEFATVFRRFAGRIALIDRDVLTVPAEELKSAAVLFTMFDGKIVYGSEP